MRCSVCGQDYGLTHNCAGVAAAAPASDVAPPPAGFALFHYLHEGIRIARWDDDAIHRTMNDSRAILYGVIVYGGMLALQVAVPVLRLLLTGRAEQSLGLVVTAMILIPSVAALDLARIGVCHLLSKWFADGTGKFLQLLGPLFLGSVVYALAAIPLVALIAGLAWIAVFVNVFQEVHGIKPLTAFLFSAGVGLIFEVIQLYSLHLIG